MSPKGLCGKARCLRRCCWGVVEPFRADWDVFRSLEVCPPEDTLFSPGESFGSAESFPSALLEETAPADQGPEPLKPWNKTTPSQVVTSCVCYHHRESYPHTAAVSHLLPREPRFLLSSGSAIFEHRLSRSSRRVPPSPVSSQTGIRT